MTRTFTNTMSCRDGRIDPDRSLHMQKREEAVLTYLQKRKAALSDEYAYRIDPNAWVTKYTDELKWRMECETGDVKLYMQDATNVKGSADWVEVVHGSRRMIALHHQESELIQQGIDIPLLAFQSNASIARGNR